MTEHSSGAWTPGWAGGADGVAGRNDGTVAFTNARSNAHVISDLAGFFIDPANIPP